ncbi:MarR family winged helix-turn-helix transcriptional regulator [Catenulispora pinisilvae]|uniref:MarR family winged helix-turn-helix transcriptional regulator n=2 Tax=Catenulispora pinisilvae TaxID=2705253 RepID=UPI001E53EC37|nr:helix-turn-helix domain-containing protein [Catenulispora pinisilvae]
MTTTGPQRDLVHLLSLAEHRAVHRQTALLQAQGEGCSIEQWRVLNLLADGQGHTMTEVAKYALLPAPTATKLIDRLVTDNLVYRRPDPDEYSSTPPTAAANYTPASPRPWPSCNRTCCYRSAPAPS